MNNTATGLTVITGGTTGLGRELVRECCNRGDTVVTCGRSVGLLADLSTDHPSTMAINADLADPHGRKAFAAAVESRERPVDLLIHNAAVQFQHDFAGCGALAERVEGEISLNLIAPIELTIDLLPMLRRSAKPQIVFISSALARVPKRSAPVYCATKAAISSFARSLRYQLTDTDIRVSEIVPDLIRTGMIGRRDAKAMEPSEAARRILDGLARDRQEIRLGRVPFLYGLHRLFPDLAYGLLKAG